MDTVVIRNKLHQYIEDANDKKVKQLFNVIEKEFNISNHFSLSKEHLTLLQEEREKHLNGKTKSYRWKEAKKIIRGTEHSHNV